MDAIDGTRLLECGWADWCSAAAVIDPSERRIICSVVVLPSGTSFAASDDGAFKYRVRRGILEIHKLSVRPTEPRRSRAIAFYGYRPPRFRSVGRAVDKIHFCSSVDPDMFVVGGNPAFVRLVDDCKGIDAVVDPIGQAPHDMVPGAYVCQQAGGYITDLSHITLDLAGLLFEAPGHKVAYLATRSEEIAAQVARDLRLSAWETPSTRTRLPKHEYLSAL